MTEGIKIGTIESPVGDGNIEVIATLDGAEIVIGYFDGWKQFDVDALATYVAAAAGGLVTFNGRGAANVVPAAGDYSAGQITNTSSVTGETVAAALDTLKAASIPDGERGDITVSGGGTVLAIQDNAVDNAAAADMATATLKGRASAGTGDPEDLSKAQVRAILNVADGADVTGAGNVDAAGAVMNTDATVAAMQFVIDDDSMAAASATKLATSESVKAYVDTEIAAIGGLTDGNKGDITISSGGTVFSVNGGAITNAKSANMLQATMKGRNAGAGTGAPQDLTPAQVRAVLGIDLSAFGGAAVTATGSTEARALADRFADVTNVRDFGAVGDGVTDDLSAIGAAITAAGDDGVLLFPKGVYFVTGTISARSGQTWIGQGATIRINNSFLAGSIDSGTTYWSDPINPVVYVGDGIDNVTLGEFTIDVVDTGSGGDLSKCQAIMVGNKDYYYSAQGTRDNIRIQNITMLGASLLSGGIVGILGDGVIEGCTIRQTAGHGVRVPNSNGLVIRNNLLDHIAVEKSDTYAWPDDTATWSNNAGIRAYNVRNLTVDGNIIRATGGTAIHVRAWHGSPVVNNITVTNNQLFACGHGGIEVQRGSSGYADTLSEVVISNNQIYGIACADDSTGHTAIFIGNKGADTTNIKLWNHTIQNNVMDFIAPYEAFSYSTYDIADWSAGAGTHNARKGVNTASNYASAIEVSDGGNAGGHNMMITGNEARHFPLALLFLQTCRSILVANNKARWCGWGRQSGGYRWSNASAFIAQTSAFVQMIGNVVENHGAGVTADDSVSPFKAQGAGIVLSGNVVDNRSLGSANSGVNYWLYVLGDASPGEFTLHNPETGADDTLAFSVYGRNNHVFDVPQGSAYTLESGDVCDVDLEIAVDIGIDESNYSVTFLEEAGAAVTESGNTGCVNIGGTLSYPNRIGDDTNTVLGDGYDGTHVAGALWKSADSGYVAGSAEYAGIIGGYDCLNNQIGGWISGSNHSNLRYNAQGHSYIGGGSYNLIEGFRCAIVGSTACAITDATANASAIIAARESLIDDSSYCLLVGDNNSITDANDSLVVGENLTVPAGRARSVVLGRDVSSIGADTLTRGSTKLVTENDVRIWSKVFSKRTTDATLSNMNSNPLNFEAGKVYAGYVKVKLVGLHDDGASGDGGNVFNHVALEAETSFMWDEDSDAGNFNGGSNVSSPTFNLAVIGTDKIGVGTCQLAMNTGMLRVKVTGPPATTINWVAEMEVVSTAALS